MHNTSSRGSGTGDADGCGYWGGLLHRWLIEFNPLYLFSAALVLSGMLLMSRGLQLEGSVYGEVGVALIAEVYAAALIGGAALLTRIGRRRPAVMLGLLTALYQCDLTLHTETCVNLGAIGAAAAVVWTAIFVGKLLFLAWALRLKLSRAAIGTATAGAVGLSAVPYALQRLDARAGSALIALWLFALVSSQVYARVTSAVPLDGWGETVLRRAVRATWLLWAALASFHVFFWSTQHTLRAETLLSIVPLLFVRRLRTEAGIWGLVFGTLVFVGVAMPSAFSSCAVVAGCALGLRTTGGARPRSADVAKAATEHATGGPMPYRGLGEIDSAIDEREPDRRLESAAVRSSSPLPPLTPEARVRLWIGAGVALYLGIWTHSWTGGAWPAHVIALDLAMAVVLVAIMAKARTRFTLAPLALGAAHLVIQMRLIPAPQTMFGWGAVTLSSGFVLLIVALATNYRLRSVEVGEPQGPV